MKNTELAIQIVNYRSKKFLEPLLGSLLADLKSSKVSAEIHILENASGDNLDVIAKKWQSKNVFIHHAKENRGFGAGHNQLARKSKAPYILILNPDILFIESRTIARLLETIHQEKVGVVGPRLLTPKSREHSALHTLSREHLVQQRWDHGEYGLSVIYRPHDHLFDALWVSGAVFLISRKAFEAVGGFDEKYFLYHEEVDLCQQLQHLGYRVVYNPDIQAVHYGGSPKVKAKHMLKSIPHYIRKHHLSF